MTPIKFALIESGTPQYLIARRAVIDETRMSRIATGRVTPTNDEIAALSAALGVPEAELRKPSIGRRQGAKTRVGKGES